MARRVSRYPTELELEILKILWRQGSLSVRDVRESLVGVRTLAHTSVLTMMNIMTNKGYLTRDRSGKRYIYAPTAPEEDMLRGMVTDLVDRAFEGSTVGAITALLDARALNETQLQQVRQRLERTGTADED